MFQTDYMNRIHTGVGYYGNRNDGNQLAAMVCLIHEKITFHG